MASRIAGLFLGTWDCCGRGRISPEKVLGKEGLVEDGERGSGEGKSLPLECSNHKLRKTRQT